MQERDNIKWEMTAVGGCYESPFYQTDINV